MIFQQRIRLSARPREQQDTPTLILSAIRQFFLDRAALYNAESASVQRLEFENATLVDDVTHVDMVTTIDAATVVFSDLFLKSFLRRDNTYPFILIHHDYVGM